MLRCHLLHLSTSSSEDEVELAQDVVGLGHGTLPLVHLGREQDGTALEVTPDGMVAWVAAGEHPPEWWCWRLREKQQ